MSYNTALIVDDSKLARIALKKKLEKRGLQIVMAEDAKEALGVLKNTDVDIVFMDHLMPDMDGFEATRKIKENAATAHLPVIMCSGKEKQGYLEEARAIGASNVLPKPAENEAIDAVFAELEASAVQEAPVAVQPEPAMAPPEVDEQQLQKLLQPMTEQLRAIAIQLDAQAEEMEQRFAVSNDSLRAIEEKQVPEAVDVDGLQADMVAQIEQQLAALEIPEAEAMQSSIRQQLVVQLESDMKSQWQQDLSAAIGAATTGLEQKIQRAGRGDEQDAPAMEAMLEGVEQRVSRSIEAAMMQMVEDKGEQLEDAWRQQMQAMRDEFSRELAALGQQPADVLDVDALKHSIKAELMEQWDTQAPAAEAANDGTEVGTDEASLANEADEFLQGVEGDQYSGELSGLSMDSIPSYEAARSGDIKVLAWLSLFSGLAAAAAIALHWV